MNSAMIYYKNFCTSVLQYNNMIIKKKNVKKRVKRHDSKSKKI
jgi:hypothetical protein